MPDRPLVHVVDDDAAMRESLDFLLASAGFAVRLHDSADAFLGCLPEVAEGCVLSDIRMPGTDGLDLLARLKSAGRSLPVILMTGHGDVPLAVEAMKRGAADFIEKPFDDEALLAALRAASARGSADVSAFARRVAGLTPRERQVFDRIVRGEPTKVVARTLEISPRTVEIYRANVMSKLGAGNLPELVRLAVEGGFVGD